MPFAAFYGEMAHHSKRRPANCPLSSISRCTTTSGNRCAPKKLIGSVTPAQDHGRETLSSGRCSIPACGFLNRAAWPHQVLWQQESPCVSGKGGPFGKQSKERKGRVVVPAARLKSWIEPFRGVMQKPPISILNVWSIGGVRYPALCRLEGRNTFFKVSRGLC
jgi:hypothetical protein